MLRCPLKRMAYISGTASGRCGQKISGDKLLVGVSACLEKPFAERDGADFITVGPIYETPSNLNMANQSVSMPSGK
jgi:thiamine monophosphate synthase